MNSRWLRCVLALTAIGAIWGGCSWIRLRADRAELNQARLDVAASRYLSASKRLAELVKRRPDWDEASYQLGLCEEAGRRYESALAEWSRIPDRSSLAVQAKLARARVLTTTGRFAAVEELLTPIPRGPDDEGTLLRKSLDILYRVQGRIHEARALILESWSNSPDPAYVLRRLYLLDNSAFPVDYVKKALADGDAKDDRVWLGRANLAIWVGRFEEAGRWLVACEKRRADDPAVWSARLEYGQVMQDVGAVRRALDHLPASWLFPVEVLRLRCWLAARVGDDALEREELRALTAEEPDDTRAWERLSELALKAGHRDEVEAYRKKKAEMSALREQYATLTKHDDRARYADELGRLARALGRGIEARGWSLIAQGRGAIDPLIPPDAPGPTASGRDVRTAAAIVDDLLVRLKRDAEPSAVVQANPTSSAPAVFADLAQSAGLRFFHDNGHTRKNPPPPEAMCGGVGLLDYDGDGWLDVYAVQGGPFPPYGSPPAQGDQLFRNRGDGRFDDVTARAGIAAFPGGYGHGVAVGDFDNDGRPDLFVTRWRSYALYRNKGDGTFEDVTIAAGLGGDRDWPTSSAFADLDGDGDLDLYVCHYLRYDPGNPRRCEHPEAPSDHTCSPISFPSLPDHVFRNDAGRFVDVTERAGFVDPEGRGLGVVAAHLDDDDRIDLCVANDMTVNYLFRNRGGFRFEEDGAVGGIACASDGNYRAGMGIACGDLDGDGMVNLAVTNYLGESTTFYRNLGGGLFADYTAAISLQAPSRPLLGFGVDFFDANNDGRLDLLSANGHVLDARPRFPWMMPVQLLLGGLGGRLVDGSERAGPAFRALHLGRGLAVGDLDHDGRLDAVVVAQNEPLIYLHNETERPGHFITLQLEGTRSNRDAVGARITIASGGRRQVAQRHGGGSYLSAADPRIHFGLGEATRVDRVEVRWPSGRLDRYAPLEADAAYHLREGSPEARPLAGWARRP